MTSMPTRTSLPDDELCHEGSALMDFDACLRAAKAAGKVDPVRADLVEKEYLDLV